jgi:sulfite reductase (NADPH) flavoprotein alpha-component
MTKYLSHTIFSSTIKKRQLISHPSSTRKTYHIVLDTKNADIKYQTGDSIGVLPQNDNIQVQNIIKLLKANEFEIIIKAETTLTDFLTYYANLSRITPALLHLIVKHHKNYEKKQKLENLLQSSDKHDLHNFLKDHEILDLLEENAEVIINDIQEFCNCLTKLSPRLYSIASSHKIYPYEIHIIVVLINYTSNNKERFGVASRFLCQGDIKTPIPFYLHRNKNIIIPDNSKDILMIGAGTGIAPFISLLQEREANNATGKNWLIFGERHRNYDFYFKDFILDLEKKNMLSLDLAFSRDQAEKIYVQDKIIEKSKTIWQWIENGCYIYLCGKAKTMATHAQSELISIIQTNSNISEEEAKNYLLSLKKEKRFLKEVC